MQIEVDNEILAALIDAHFGVKHKISLNSEKKNYLDLTFYLFLHKLRLMIDFYFYFYKKFLMMHPL